MTATLTSTAVDINSTTLRRLRIDGGFEIVNTVDVSVSIVDNDTSAIVVTHSGQPTTPT